MRVADRPLVPLPPPTQGSTTPTAAQPGPSLPPTASAAPGEALIDHVSALVDRLAVQAGASGHGDADAAQTDPQVLALMRDVFGVSSISDLHLDFDYEHRAESGSNAALAVGGNGAAYAHASAYALDATSLSAKGTFTFTDADGHRYAFTLQYAAVSAEAVDLDQASVSGSVSPTQGSVLDGAAAPTFVGATGPTPDDGAWRLSALMKTIAKPNATAPTLIERLRLLLGLQPDGTAVAA